MISATLFSTGAYGNLSFWVLCNLLWQHHGGAKVSWRGGVDGVPARAWLVRLPSPVQSSTTFQADRAGGGDTGRHISSMCHIPYLPPRPKEGIERAVGAAWVASIEGQELGEGGSVLALALALALALTEAMTTGMMFLSTCDGYITAMLARPVPHLAVPYAAPMAAASHGEERERGK